MGWRIQTKSGDEWDLTSKARRKGWLPSWAGRWAKIKRAIRHRARVNAKQSLRKLENECSRGA